MKIEDNLKKIIKHDKDIENLGSQLDNITQQKAEKTHKLKYKSVSMTVSPTKLPLDNDCKHLKTQGVNATLIAMCNVTSITDANITNMSISKVEEAIDKIRNQSVEIDMLKPHIGLNYSDSGFFRGDYNPADFNIAFNNWKNILLEYASLCNSKKIPILCISCEQEKMELDIYESKWLDIYSTIKGLYPNLVLLHARTHQTALGSDVKIYNHCDMLGVNVYLSYSIKSYDGTNISFDDVAKGFFGDLKGFNVVGGFYELCRKLNKNMFITEIGVMPKVDGLRTVVATGTTNYGVQGLLFNTLLEVLCSYDFIDGLSIWHVDEPFKYFSDTSILPGEQQLIKYFKGGIR